MLIKHSDYDLSRDPFLINLSTYLPFIDSSILIGTDYHTSVKNANNISYKIY